MRPQAQRYIALANCSLKRRLQCLVGRLFDILTDDVSQTFHYQMTQVMQQHYNITSNDIHNVLTAYQTGSKGSRCKISAMKIIIICFLFLTSLQIKAQQKQQFEKENIEQAFSMFFKSRIVEELKNFNLGEDSISRIQFYRYKIVRNDSITFNSANWQIKEIDSIVKISFYDAVDSMRKKQLLRFLIEDGNTYIPIIILYKTSTRSKLNEKISISPFEEIFDWQIDIDTKRPESIIRMVSPIILRLPLSKPI